MNDELQRRRDFMQGRGYVRCDIAACNCNGWHGGHSEARLQEIADALSESDLDTNGRTILQAVKYLLERDWRLSQLEK